jgi:hypothetical protein
MPVATAGDNCDSMKCTSLRLERSVPSKSSSSSGVLCSGSCLQVHEAFVLDGQTPMLAVPYLLAISSVSGTSGSSSVSKSTKPFGNAMSCRNSVFLQRARCVPARCPHAVSPSADNPWCQGWLRQGVQVVLNLNYDTPSPCGHPSPAGIAQAGPADSYS